MLRHNDTKLPWEALHALRLCGLRAWHSRGALRCLEDSRDAHAAPWAQVSTSASALTARLTSLSLSAQAMDEVLQEALASAERMTSPPPPCPAVVAYYEALAHKYLPETLEW